MSTQRATKISDIVTNKIETVGPLSTAQDVAIKMKEKRVSSILLIDDKQDTPQGIITERDLSRKVCVSDKSSKEILAKQIMSSPLITIDADLSPSDAADLMLKNNVRHLLVVTKGSNQPKNNNEISKDQDIVKPIGIITPMDFTRFESNDIPDNDRDNINKILEYYRNDFDFA